MRGTNMKIKVHKKTIVRITFCEFANFAPHIVINVILITRINGKESAVIWEVIFHFVKLFRGLFTVNQQMKT